MRKPKLIDRPRMADLDRLPIFFNVRGKRALIAGGGEAAAWKAELLSAAGATVLVAAEKLNEEFSRVIALRPNQFIRLGRGWMDHDFDEIVLAIGEFSDDREAHRFAEAARSTAKPVNVIDNPSYCDFQFGSIVNRSPVVVSVSTGGAAPALGQSIRSKIEVLLPPALSEWANVAKRIRPRLKGLLPNDKQRVAFWRRFANAAFAKPSGDIRRIVDGIIASSETREGSVTLVGAGPGSAGLLTLDAMRALQSADIILFDDLVSDEVLELARREAKRMMVGKRGHRASCKQDDINNTMLSLAKSGKNVVRLKSGDPMIFGRAGEEIAMLEAAGVAVSIIPGVTAALAAAARLRTSLTHRDCAQGVKFVTAHSRQGALPDLDWGACADANTTLMVYMGARTACDLANRLLEEGLAPQTPVVVAEGVSSVDEHITSMRLADLARERIQAAAPVLIGVGQVFSRARADRVVRTLEDHLRPSPRTVPKISAPALDVAAQQ